MEPPKPASNNGKKEDEIAASLEKQSSPQALNVRSPEVQEIIGRPPHWLVRGGTVAFFGMLILILTVAAVIKYPATLNARLKIKAINAPKAIQSNITAKLVKLNVKNGTWIQKGTVLGWLESSASHKQVLEISVLVDSMYKWLQKSNYERLKTVQLKQFTDLGELQPSFQSFVQKYRIFTSYLPDSFYYKQRQLLKHEIRYNQMLLEKLKEQKKVLKQQYKLAKEAFKMQKKLAEQGVISSKKMSVQKSKLLNSRLPLINVKSAIINNHITRNLKKKELQKLNKKINKQKSVFLQALNTLKSAVKAWKEKYFLTAPISGKCIYTGIVQVNQTIIGGQEVFFIKPQSISYFGVMRIGQHSFGKIHKGQKVLVRFNGYPAYEFGTVTGKIAYLSDFPVQDSLFVAKVRFEDLVTSYNRKIPPTNGMTGKAEIILQDMRLLERFYNNIAKQIK